MSQVSRVKTVPASAGRYQECVLARRSLVGLRRSLARIRLVGRGLWSVMRLVTRILYSLGEPHNG
jgi:hypothetical protein